MTGIAVVPLTYVKSVPRALTVNSLHASTCAGAHACDRMTRHT
jgi:hypothetical protein